MATLADPWGGLPWRRYADAIAAIESQGSGGYGALGPQTGGDRAYGKYQVMGANVGPWTERHVGRRMTPQEFLSDPEAQDAVFRGQFGGYLSRHGNPADAASMWFTGRPYDEGRARRDVLGTTGGGYVARFMSGLGNAAPAAQPGSPTMATAAPDTNWLHALLGIGTANAAEPSVPLRTDGFSPFLAPQPAPAAPQPTFNPFTGPPGEGAPNVLRQPGEGMLPGGMAEIYESAIEAAQEFARRVNAPPGAVPSATMGAPLGPSIGIGSDAVAAPDAAAVADQSEVPPFVTTVQPEPAAAPTPARPPAIASPMGAPAGPGYFERLLSNPAFLAGLSILGTPPGGTWGPAGARAASLGLRSRREQSEYQRQQQRRSTMDRVWQAAFPNGQPDMEHPLLRGQSPQAAAMLYTLGPEAALPLLAKSSMGRRKLELKDVGGVPYIFDPRSGQVVQLPGARRKPPEAIRTQAIKADQALNAILPELERYSDLVQKSGFTFQTNAERDAVQQSRTNLLLQIKQLHDLGALQAPDMAIMERLLIETDPGFLSNVPGITQNPSERVAAAMARLRQMLIELRNSQTSAIGLPPADATPQPSGNDPLGIR